MRAERSLASMISREARKILVWSVATQVIVVASVLLFLCYKSASEQAQFLLRSNKTYLSLLISTGDVFQLRNVLSSLKNELTPGIWILDDTGQEIDTGIAASRTLAKLDAGIHFYEGRPALISHHELSYNDQRVGSLIVASRIDISGFLAVSLAILMTAIGMFLIQRRVIEAFVMSLGKGMTGLGDFFDHSASEEQQKLFYSTRKSTGVQEFEELASRISQMISKIIRAASLEKEAEIGRITANLSHDLRTPLGIIERVLALPDDKPIGEMKLQIRQSLYRLNAMIDSLRSTDLDQMIRPSLRRLEFGRGLCELKAKADNQGKRVISSEILQNREALVDHEKFERAWLNIACNAVDFARSEISLELHEKADRLVLLVKDDGPGVPDSFLPRLFERGATHGKTDGTGLGLAFAKQVIRGHGGDVVYRRENGRTTFECWIPANGMKQTSQFLDDVIPQSQKPQPDDCRIQTIALAILPRDLCEKIRDELIVRISDAYRLVPDYEFADIVISNDKDLLLKAMDDSKFPIEINAALPFDKLISRLEKRLG